MDMELTWQPWTSVSQGSTTPGAPLAALPWQDSFALFLSDPNGGIYAIKATPGYGWEVVPGLTSKPGGQITARLSGSLITLFTTDANGEVFTTSGAPYQGWQPWSTVSQGGTTPGAPLPAIAWDGSFALFLTDPNGGIYAIKATPGYGWEPVPGLTSKPGAPITAVLVGSLFTLFTTDVNGEVFTTSGAPYQGWQPWTAVSQGSTTPGATIAAAMPWDNSFALILSDPSGNIYAIKATPGYGWEPVPGRSCKPGGQIAVMGWTRPPTSSGSASADPQLLLIMVDVNGDVSFTTGLPYQSWDPWTTVPGLSSVPGAPVAVSSSTNAYPFWIFVTDSNGEVYGTSNPKPLPLLSFSPTSLNFDPKKITNHTVTLGNTGTAPLTIESIAIADPNFSMTNTCNIGAAGGTLQPGQQCTVNVTCRFLANGGSSQMVITHNASITPAVVELNATSAGGGGGR